MITIEVVVHINMCDQNCEINLTFIIYHSFLGLSVVLINDINFDNAFNYEMLQDLTIAKNCTNFFKICISIVFSYLLAVIPAAFFEF